jgi:hypothetical protein
MHLGELRGLQQSDCEAVSLPDPIGKPLRYKITKFGKDHLILELQGEALAEATVDLPAPIAAGFKKFPAVKKYEIYVPNASRMDLASEYITVPGDCPGATSFEVREELTYRWSENSEKQVRLDRAYFERLKGLSAEPPPVVVGLNSPENSGEVVLSFADAVDLQKQLQASSHVSCN